MTIVAKSTIDPKTGDLHMQVLPQEFDSRQKAHDAMREEYFKELKKLGLEDNDAMDETCEESCEGGWMSSRNWTVSVFRCSERTFRQTPQCFRIRIQWIKQSAMLAPPFFLELDAMSSPT